MSEISEIIGALENKIQKLCSKIDSLEEKNQVLQQELKISTNQIVTQKNEVESLKKNYDTLKITNSLLGSEDNKRDTKFKINSLIREIDYCIAQLSD